MASTDRIEKQILLRATPARVWRALTDHEEFGSWFRVQLDGPFEVGKTVGGKMTYPGYENLSMELVVERMDEEQVFSYRWHPAAIEPDVDYSREPTTLVEFRIEEAPGGTLLTLVESGFAALPEHRRLDAFRRNGEGWDVQLGAVRSYVES